MDTLTVNCERWLLRCGDQTRQRAIEKLELEYAALLKCSTGRLVLGADLLELRSR
jgi:hypothetical protein